MRKTDGRHYNRQENRDLSLNMDLWIQWHGKLAKSSRNAGEVTDIEVQRVSTKLRRVEVEFNHSVKERFLLDRRTVLGLEAQ